MEKKITKAQMFAQIREVVADHDDMVEFIDQYMMVQALSVSPPEQGGDSLSSYCYNQIYIVI